MHIEFKLRTHLAEKDKQRLEEDISRFFGGHHSNSSHDVAKATISRLTDDPGDDRIIIAIRSHTGTPLGSLTADANGTGPLLFIPPE